MTSRCERGRELALGGSGVDDHSLRLLEYDRVTAALAARAAGSGARALLRAWRPRSDAAERARETARLGEAIRRQREPDPWCRVGPGDLAPRLAPEAQGALDGPGLVEVLAWLEAARETWSLWSDEAARQRFAALAALVDGLPEVEGLRGRLASSLEPDGAWPTTPRRTWRGCGAVSSRASAVCSRPSSAGRAASANRRT